MSVSSETFLGPLPAVEGNLMTPVLILALELVVLYSCGSYAMIRLAAWASEAAPGRQSGTPRGRSARDRPLPGVPAYWDSGRALRTLFA